MYLLGKWMNKLTILSNTIPFKDSPGSAIQRECLVLKEQKNQFKQKPSFQREQGKPLALSLCGLTVKIFLK